MSSPRLASVVVLSTILFLQSACSTRAPVVAPVPEPEPPVRLNDADATALAELLRMEDVRMLDTALVARHLASTNREVRARAALAAGRIVGNKQATPLLLNALEDAHAHVRTSAAFALGELADSSDAVIHALGAVALRDTSAVAVEAIGALGRIGVPAARLYIDSLLLRPRLPDALRHEALIVAWRLPRDSATIAHVARWTLAPDAELRWRAAYSLARTAGPRGLPALLELMRDPDARVRMQAVRGLRASSADSTGVRERALTALLAATNDTDPQVRINAINALAPYRDNARATPALLARLQDADANVAVAAAQALTQTRDVGAVPGLRAIAATAAAAVGVRTAALTTIAALDSLAAAQIAAEWATADNTIMRMYAARVLARAPWQMASPTLLRLARVPHYLVAGAALTSIRTSDSLPEKRIIFVELLGAAHPIVRAGAARGLARYATIADLDLLLQAYDRARRDTMRDAAAAVVDALGRLTRAGVPVERSFFLRFGDAPPADPALHRAIATNIGAPPASWGAPRPRQETRALDFYVDIVHRYVVPVVHGDAAPRASISTIHGDIELELAAADAPLTVHNFLSLIDAGYYNSPNTRWHRVVPNFVIQDGDPRGDGGGGPGYSIRDEINMLRYDRGMLGMAHSGPDTGSGQWFITHSPQPHLDGGYTIFGRVVRGMEVVDRVVQEEPVLGMRSIR